MLPKEKFLFPCAIAQKVLGKGAYPTEKADRNFRKDNHLLKHRLAKYLIFTTIICS